MGICTLLASCGGELEATVSGTVMINNEPLMLGPGEVGSVMFHPTRGGPESHSQIGKDGSYRLTTGQQRGLAPGEYKVTIIATRLEEVDVGIVVAPTTDRITPVQYGRADESPLQFTVNPGRNRIDLKMIKG